MNRCFGLEAEHVGGSHPMLRKAQMELKEIELEEREGLQEDWNQAAPWSRPKRELEV